MDSASTDINELIDELEGIISTNVGFTLGTLEGTITEKQYLLKDNFEQTRKKLHTALVKTGEGKFDEAKAAYEEAGIILATIQKETEEDAIVPIFSDETKAVIVKIGQKVAEKKPKVAEAFGKKQDAITALEAAKH